MNLKMEDLVDIPLLQEFLDKLNEIYEFPSAIIDDEGKVLTATAWQDICTKFHRMHPISEQLCILSDQYIIEHIHDAKPAVSYTCPHGLTDNAIPVIIGGRHIANFFTGQFFLEPPDIEYFRNQAELYGFDKEKYLQAVLKVPIWDKSKLHIYLEFINTFTKLLADIGERKLKEIESIRKLSESEAKFRAVFENSFDAIGVSKNGINIFINKAYIKLFGFESEKDINGKPAINLIAPSQRQFVNEIIDRRTFRHNAPSQYETLGIRKDGTEFVMDVRATVFNFDNENYTLVILRDVTSNKQALEKLSLSEAQFRQTFELSPVGAVIVGLDRRFHRVNNAFSNFLGYSPEELYGLTIDDVTFHEDRHIGLAEMSSIIKGEIESVRLRKRYLTKKGDIVWGEITISLVRDKYNKPLYFLPIIQDITERKNTETKLNKLNESLEQKVIERTEELNKALLSLENTNIELKELNDAISKESTELVKLNDKLAESEQQLRLSNETKDRFFSIIAHDLKNPLQGLLFTSDLLVKNIDNYDKETIKNKTQQFYKTAGELSGLLENMLNWARSQSGRITFQPELFDLNKIIFDTIDLFEENTKLKNISIEFSTNGNNNIFADRNLLGAVIRNLISNAVKFSGNDTSVSIITLKSEKQIQVSVKDNGIGMSEQEIQTLFKIDTTTPTGNKSPEKGTGLGLIICKDFIEKHNGSIWAESQPGKGSTFHFVLPQVREN